MARRGLKVRAAEWLYRWNLSLGILGIVFTILTFLGVFTILLRPVFSRVGLSDLETALILFLLVVVVIIGFGVFLDKIVRFWAAQATVATVRNPYLVDFLYQKELLSLRYIQLPLLRSVQALLANPQPTAAERTEMLADLEKSIAKIERSIRERRWPVEEDERVY